MQRNHCHCLMPWACLYFCKTLKATAKHPVMSHAWWQENKQIELFMSTNVDCQLSVTDTHSRNHYLPFCPICPLLLSIHLFQYQNSCLWRENCLIYLTWPTLSYCPDLKYRRTSRKNKTNNWNALLLTYVIMIVVGIQVLDYLTIILKANNKNSFP